MQKGTYIVERSFEHGPAFPWRQAECHQAAMTAPCVTLAAAGRASRLGIPGACRGPSSLQAREMGKESMQAPWSNKDTAQHSTAQQSTTQHSTAQCSAAQQYALHAWQLAPHLAAEGRPRGSGAAPPPQRKPAPPHPLPLCLRLFLPAPLQALGQLPLRAVALAQMALRQ